MVRKHKLSTLSGVPAQMIREWRRRGFVPSDRELPDYWVDVLRDVYHKRQPKIADLFLESLQKHRG